MKVAKLPNGDPELFYTIQGEGTNVGKPSVFLRLSLCNLHCSWCDTPYTWNWENTPWKTDTGTKYKKTEQIISLSPLEIKSLLEKEKCKNLVLTGGEPLIQQVEIKKLLELLSSEWSVEIETNGTIIPESLAHFSHVQYNVSPKLSHSGNPVELALIPASLEWFSKCPKAYFKFVLSRKEDLEEVRELQERYNIPYERIVLMPRGTSSEEIKKSSLEIINLCMEHQYRFSDRLHVHIWGNTRAK